MRIILIILLFSQVANAQSVINPYVFGTSSFDADAQDYINRVEAHGVTLTGAQETAINNFFLGAKSNSLYTTALYDGGLLIFANSGANGESFKGLHDITWNGTVTHASTGVTSNGTTGYAGLGFNGNVLTLNNSRISVYCNTNTAITNAVDIGAASSATVRCLIFIKTGSNLLSDHNSGTAGSGRLTAANSDASGYFISSRVSSTDHRVFRNGSQLGTTATGTNNGTFPAVNMILMALNTSGTITNYSTRELKYWDAGEGLNTTQAATWSTLVATLLAVINACIATLSLVVPSPTAP